METPSEILRKHGVEIDAGDHRTPAEIVRALGMQAMPESVAPPSAEAHWPVARADRIERSESRPYFA